MIKCQVFLSDFDQKEVSLSAIFVSLARNPKTPGPKLTELSLVLGHAWIVVNFFLQNRALAVSTVQQSRVWSSPQPGPGHLGRRRERD